MLLDVFWGFMRVKLWVTYTCRWLHLLLTLALVTVHGWASGYDYDPIVAFVCDIEGQTTFRKFRSAYSLIYSIHFFLLVFWCCEVLLVFPLHIPGAAKMNRKFPIFRWVEIVVIKALLDAVIIWILYLYIFLSWKSSSCNFVVKWNHNYLIGV